MMKLALVVLLSMTALTLGEQEKRILGGITNILSGNSGSGGACLDLMALLETLGYDTQEAFFADADLNGDGTVTVREARMYVSRLNAQGRLRGMTATGGAGASAGGSMNLMP